MKFKKLPLRLIMGKNCVEEVLEHDPGRIVELYLAKGATLDFPFKGKVRELSKQELNALVASDSHQGIVAAVKERGSLVFKEFCKELAEKDKSVLLMLDSIYDPHNLGAIMRAAECFGADGVIWSKNRGADLTPVASKVSVGGSELVNLFKVSNLVESLKTLQDAGFYGVACEAKPGSETTHSFKFPSKTVIILGSEGEGIQKLLSQKSDYHVQIPMLGRIDSLNVSQAAAVMLAFYRSN